MAKAVNVSDKDEQAEFERLIGSNDMLPFYVLELGSRVGAAVCKLGFDDEEDGTGFLIGPDVLITNNHVLPTPKRAREARCIFDYQLGIDRKPKETVKFHLDPDSLFITSDDENGLDYTFVRIDPAAASRFGSILISRGSFSSLIGEFAHIIQHPSGKMKRVALRDNRIYEDDSIIIRYTADTEPGSSGSPVFNSDWQVIALHHASKRLTRKQIAAEPELADYNYLNEAIKLSAIASDLERQLQTDTKKAAREVLRCFHDTDSMLGYFGGLGRPAGAGSDFEKVVKRYEGEAHDIDVGFWNVEWFTRRFEEKTPEVAKIFAELQLDIYALMESSPAAADHLVRFLHKNYGLEFDYAASEPDSVAGKQSTTVLWNKQTIAHEKVDWPDEVKPWFDVDSRNFDEIDLEAVHGKVFNRYPGLFRFKALNREGIGEPFDFFLVPLHLKAMAEGSLRRRMASRILGAAIARMTAAGHDQDWILGGDFNAELATGDFAALAPSMLPISAEDEEEGAMTYLKSPRSLIDHIFISPNLARTYGAKDFFIVAADTKTPQYIQKVSDHRPVLMRLSLKPGEDGERKNVAAPALPPGLSEALALGERRAIGDQAAVGKSVT
jgi:V8-like Glu-specific endopeptidase